jgi:hypothetical protein
VSLRRLLAIVSLFAAAACGSAGERVAMDREQTDIVFGFTANEARRARATPAARAAQEEEQPDLVAGPTSPPPIFFPTQPSTPCPTAAPDAPVENSAGTDIVGRPKEGSYAWRGAGTYKLSSADIPVPNAFDQHLRSVADLNDPSGPAYTFETIEPRIGAQTAGYWLYSWSVKTAAPSADPEAGLALKRIDILDASGKRVDTYVEPFGSGVMLMPLPIKPGQTWNSATIDLNRGRSLQVSGQVLARELVDACGTLVQGWQVKADFTETGNTASLDYIFAPQLAGRIIQMKIDGTYLGTAFTKATFVVGKLERRELQKEFRP